MKTTLPTRKPHTTRIQLKQQPTRKQSSLCKRTRDTDVATVASGRILKWSFESAWESLDRRWISSLVGERTRAYRAPVLEAIKSVR